MNLKEVEMSVWTQFNREKPKIKLNHLISEYIVRELGSYLTDFFSYKSRIGTQRTRLIKDKLSELGKKN